MKTSKELKTALVFAGSAFLLSKAQKRKVPPAQPAAMVKTPQSEVPTHNGESIEGTFSVSSNGWEDSNYMGGFLVGAASVGAAWYAWSVFRPKLRRAATPDSY